jgi:hypothetical protein
MEEDTKIKTLGVLFRTNKQAEALQTACLHAKVPHQVVGGLNFFNRTEIRDALAFLRVLENPWDDTALKRIINKPRRKIGHVTFKHFFGIVGTTARAAWNGTAKGSGRQRQRQRQRPPSALTCLFAFLPDEELEAGIGAALQKHGPKLAMLRAEARRQELGLRGGDDERSDGGALVQAAAASLAEDPFLHSLHSLVDPTALSLARVTALSRNMGDFSISALENFARVMMGLAVKACELSVPRLLEEVLYGEGVALAQHYSMGGEGNDCVKQRKRLDDLVLTANDDFGDAGPAWGGALGRYLGEAALMSSAGSEEEEEEEERDRGKVLKLMTIHKSKGLEFDAVFVAGLDERELRRDVFLSLWVCMHLWGGWACVVRPLRFVSFRTSGAYYSNPLVCFHAHHQAPSTARRTPPWRRRSAASSTWPSREPRHASTSPTAAQPMETRGSPYRTSKRSHRGSASMCPCTAAASIRADGREARGGGEGHGRGKMGVDGRGQRPLGREGLVRAEARDRETESPITALLCAHARGAPTPPAPLRCMWMH